MTKAVEFHIKNKPLFKITEIQKDNGDDTQNYFLNILLSLACAEHDNTCVTLTLLPKSADEEDEARGHQKPEYQAACLIAILHQLLAKKKSPVLFSQKDIPVWE